MVLMSNAKATGESSGKEPLLKKIKGNVLSEGGMLTVIPFLGSLLALVFETSYLAFYGVPLNIIKLDFVKVISATAFISIYLMAAFLCLLVARKIIRGKHPLRKAALIPTAVVLSVGFLAFIFKIPNKTLLLTSIFIALYLTVLIIPTFKIKGNKKYIEKLDDYTDDLAKSDSEIKVTVFDKAALLVMATVFVVSAANDRASSKEKYWTPADNPNRVIVEIYDDLAVMKDIDPESKRLKPGVVLLKFSDSTPLNLERRKVGPLQRESD